jgi:hypothetical protein
MVRVSDVYYNPKGRLETGHGQAKYLKQVRVQEMRMAGRLEVRAGRMIRQAGSESGQARVKTRED